MAYPTFLVTFPHDLRPDLPLRAERVPVPNEVLVLDGERWVVDTVEWTPGDDRFVVHPTVVVRPSVGLRADLRSLAAASATASAGAGDVPDGAHA